MLKTKVILSFILFLIFSTGNLNALNQANQDPRYTQAQQLFEAGQYMEARLLFERLLQESPEDHLLNYYYGASLTENNHFSETALNHLLKSLEGTPPEMVHYYLGMQYQAQEQWDQAIRQYNQFRIKAPDDRAIKFAVAEKIQQCLNHENPYSLSEAPVPALTEGMMINDAVSVVPDSTVSIEEAPEPKPADTGVPVEFRVNTEITYLNTNHFRTDLGKELFMKARKLQDTLASNLDEASQLRQRYQSAGDNTEKQAIGEKILALENESYRLKEQIAGLLKDTRIVENDYWQSAGSEEVARFRKQLANIPEEQPAEPQTEIADTSLTIDPAVLLVPEQVAAPAEKTESDLVYKIQIGAYSRKLPDYVDRTFKKLSLIRKIDTYTDEKGVVVYTTGNLKNLEDAIKMKNQVRQEGIEDAFVVPYFNGKRITLEQAKKIEAEL